MKPKDESSHHFPPPPRFLLVAFPLLSLLCFLGSYSLNHHPSRISNAGIASTGQTTLQVSFKDKEGATALQVELQGEGYQAAIRGTQTHTKTGKGFIVAQDLDPAAGKPVMDTLSEIYHLPVSMTTRAQDRVRVQVGPVYKSEADANKMVQKLKRLGFDWKIFSNSDNAGGVYQVVISNIPHKKLQRLKKELSRKGLQIKN